MSQFCLEKESVYFCFLNNFLGRTVLFMGEGDGKLQNWFYYAEHFESTVKTS